MARMPTPIGTFVRKLNCVAGIGVLLQPLTGILYRAYGFTVSVKAVLLTVPSRTAHRCDV